MNWTMITAVLLVAIGETLKIYWCKKLLKTDKIWGWYGWQVIMYSSNSDYIDSWIFRVQEGQEEMEVRPIDEILAEIKRVEHELKQCTQATRKNALASRLWTLKWVLKLGE